VKLFKILLWKAYFDKGFGITSYAKYFIAFFGLASQDIMTTLWIGFFYGIFCFFLGWGWYRFKIIETENEVSNVFNPFCRDVRNSLGTKNLNSLNI